MRPSRLIPIALALLCACSKPKSSDRHDDVPDTEASTSPHASASPSAKAEPVAPEGSTPAVRVAEAAQVAGAFDVRARLLVSKVASEEGLGVAFAFAAAPGKEPPAGTSVPHAWDETLASLKFNVTAGGATTVLQLRDKPDVEGGYLGANGADRQTVFLTGAGFGVFPWKTPAPKVFATPGKYTLKIEGQLSISGAKTPFALDPIPFEVAATSDTFKTIEALAKIAHDRAAVIHPKDEARADWNVVDDVADNRWHRLTFPSQGYDIHVVEILLSPAGKVVAENAYDHFSCVVAGTAIDTASGPVPIESLRRGDTVLAFDFERNERVETLVLETQSSFAVELVDLGGLLVTPTHPVYADGAFTPAGRLSASVTLRDRYEQPVRVDAVAYSSSPRPVIDLSVAWPHNFYAGGILVHNKAVHVPLGPRDDRWAGVFFWPAAKSAD